MESKKSKPNQTNQTKVKRTNRQATNSRQPRQIGIGMYCFSPSPYLPISVPISVPIYAVCLLVYVAVYRRNDHYALIQDLPSPPLFRSVKILVAFLQFFFEIFFWNFFFAEFHKVLFSHKGLFCGCGYFWESAFFGLSILIEKDSFFFLRVVFSEIVQFGRKVFW